jgi:hypothetical protein
MKGLREEGPEDVTEFTNRGWLFRHINLCARSLQLSDLEGVVLMRENRHFQ